MLVTQATYGRGYEAASPRRFGACLRGSGHDVLLDATLGGGEYSFDDIGLAGIVRALRRALALERRERPSRAAP